jgi:hypothetical protein
MVSSFLTHTWLTRGGGLRVLSMLAIFLAYLASGSTNPHSYGCYWASAAFSCSALICSSLVCHFNWQEQTAADAVEPNVPSKVECLM